MSSLVNLVRLELESEAIAELEVVSPARLESSNLVRRGLAWKPSRASESKSSALAVSGAVECTIAWGEGI